MDAADQSSAYVTALKAVLKRNAASGGERGNVSAAKLDSMQFSNQRFYSYEDMDAEFDFHAEALGGAACSFQVPSVLLLYSR